MRLTDAAARWNDRYEEKENARTGHIRLQLAQIAAKLDGLTDALIEKLIDKETFRSRKERLLLEQAKLRQQEAATERLPSAADLQAFLERINSLKATYDLANNTATH